MSIAGKIIKLVLSPFLWPVIGMPGTSHKGAFGALDSAELESKDKVERIVIKLASEIGERHSRNYAGLQQSAQFIADELRSYGYSVRSESFLFDGVEMENVEGELRGTKRPEEIIVVGAHYDTVRGSPGADDNATGIAAMLEIARLLARVAHGRTIRFVAFANEENQGNPDWHDMGSYRYACGCKQRGEKIVGMIALEMLGVFSDIPGSQVYPMPFNLLYPDVGNFIAFVGNLASRRFIRRCIGSFRRRCRFPSEGVAAPSRFRDINRSDHWSFWQFGYPGLMITDTSNFRNKLYHTDRDVPEIIQFEKLARLTVGLAAVVKDLVNV